MWVFPPFYILSFDYSKKKKMEAYSELGILVLSLDGRKLIISMNSTCSVQGEMEIWIILGAKKLTQTINFAMTPTFKLPLLNITFDDCDKIFW